MSDYKASYLIFNFTLTILEISACCRTILSLAPSCRELQNFAEEEQNIDVIQEPTVQPGKGFIPSFRCILSGQLESFYFLMLKTSS